MDFLKKLFENFIVKLTFNSRSQKTKNGGINVQAAPNSTVNIGVIPPTSHVGTMLANEAMPTRPQLSALAQKIIKSAEKTDGKIIFHPIMTFDQKIEFYYGRGFNSGQNARDLAETKHELNRLETMGLFSKEASRTYGRLTYNYILTYPGYELAKTIPESLLDSENIP